VVSTAIVPLLKQAKGERISQFVLKWKLRAREKQKYEGWNFNSGNYLFTTDTK